MGVMRSMTSYRQADAPFLEQPGRRPLYPQHVECSCRGCSIDDVGHARDVLEPVPAQLPVRARSELRRQVAPLDSVPQANSPRSLRRRQAAAL